MNRIGMRCDHSLLLLFLAAVVGARRFSLRFVIPLLAVENPTAQRNGTLVVGILEREADAPAPQRGGVIKTAAVLIDGKTADNAFAVFAARQFDLLGIAEQTAAELKFMDDF